MEIKFDDLDKYYIIHPCCDCPIASSGNVITVYSGCNGDVIFRGTLNEFREQFSNNAIWQTVDDALPAFFQPVIVNETEIKLS